jgi:hypothetical protein
MSPTYPTKQEKSGYEKGGLRPTLGRRRTFQPGETAQCQKNTRAAVQAGATEHIYVL